MDLKLESELSKLQILNEINSVKNEIDAMRPLPDSIEARVMQKLRLDWNYNSNAIEGNKLDYGETVAFLMTGITAKGKPLKDHLDIRGHNEAINFLLSLVKDSRPISEADIRALHEMILVEPYDVKAQTSDGGNTTKTIELGKYKIMPNHVKTVTGEIHYYATPEETPIRMRELMNWYKECENERSIHPVVIAALFHHKFVEIHPFDDGNGRLSRILMNLILMQKDYPPVVIKNDDRQNYYSLLSQADVGDDQPFVEYIADRMLTSLNIFLKAANGEDIYEDEDIDKEIALYKMELSNKVRLKEKRTNESVKLVLNNEIKGLFEKIVVKSKAFDDLFFLIDCTIDIDFVEGQGSAGAIDRNFSLSDIGKKFNTISLYTELCGAILLIIHFKEFKNIDFNFNVNYELKVIFDSYDYTICNQNDNKLVSKLYHEKLISQDINKVLKSFIDDMKILINSKLNQ